MSTKNLSHRVIRPTWLSWRGAGSGTGPRPPWRPWRCPRPGSPLRPPPASPSVSSIRVTVSAWAGTPSAFLFLPSSHLPAHLKTQFPGCPICSLTGVGLSLILVFNYLAQPLLPSSQQPRLNCTDSEHSKSYSKQPSPRADGTPCTMDTKAWNNPPLRGFYHVWTLNRVTPEDSKYSLILHNNFVTGPVTRRPSW